MNEILKELESEKQLLTSKLEEVRKQKEHIVFTYKVQESGLTKKLKIVEDQIKQLQPNANPS